MVTKNDLWGPGVLVGLGLGVFGLGVSWANAGPNDGAGTPPETVYYSTAAPRVNHRGAVPVQLALLEGGPAAAPVAAAESPEASTVPAPHPPAAAPAAEAPRVAAANAAAPPPAARARSETAGSSLAPTVLAPVPSAGGATIVEAIRAIKDCGARFTQVHDYTCTFMKRERIDGRLSAYNIMFMKVRNQPHSVYFKFQQPTKGREAIYVAGRNGGQVLAHDVGIGKVIAGTLALDPRGARAMEENRHPITDAGIGHLIETVTTRWEAEMKRGETEVFIHPHARVGNRACTMIESTHPVRSNAYLFHKVKVFIDQELNVPIRFEAYDWPRRPGEAPDLLEEYTYSNLRLNVGLHDRDFDPTNKQYSFGRF